MNFKYKIKEVYMRFFTSPNKYIKWYLGKNFGQVELNDGTVIVNQSKEFNKYCYGEAYELWKNKK